MGLFNALGKKHNYKFRGKGLLIRLSGRDAQFFCVVQVYVFLMYNTMNGVVEVISIYIKIIPISKMIPNSCLP